MTRDPRPERRRAAAEQLGRRGPAEEPAAGAGLVVATLHPLLRDPDAEVVCAAVISLGRLAHPDTRTQADLLLQYASPPTPDGKLAAAAILTLGRLGDDRQLPMLHERLRKIAFSDPPEPRTAALAVLLARRDGGSLARAVQILTLPVVPPPAGISQKLFDTDAVRLAALRYLDGMGAPGLTQALQTGFRETPGPDLRLALAAVLTRRTGTPHRALPDQTYERYTVESLASWSTPSVPPPPGVTADPGVVPAPEPGPRDSGVSR